MYYKVHVYMKTLTREREPPSPRPPRKNKPGSLDHILNDEGPGDEMKQVAFKFVEQCDRIFKDKMDSARREIEALKERVYYLEKLLDATR